MSSSEIALIDNKSIREAYSKVNLQDGANTSYFANSMDNICYLWNKDLKASGDSFYNEHRKICNESSTSYNKIADLIDDEMATKEDLQNMVDFVINALKKIKEELISLISKEESKINAESND